MYLHWNIIEKRLETREMLSQCCQWKGVEMIEGEDWLGQIQILVNHLIKMIVLGFMVYLEGK